MQRVSILVIVGALALGQVTMADDALAADLFVVHGINGEDLGQDEALPVDIRIDVPTADVGPEDVCLAGSSLRIRKGRRPFPTPDCMASRSICRTVLPSVKARSWSPIR
jgi:hypothetical protein